MTFLRFIQQEISDRLAQKGVLRGIWNIVFFPITAVVNYIQYQRWIKVCKSIGISENNLGKRVSISAVKTMTAAYASLLHSFFKEDLFRMNEGYVVVHHDLLVFPLFAPKNRHQFFTEIQKPIIILLEPLSPEKIRKYKGGVILDECSLREEKKNTLVLFEGNSRCRGGRIRIQKEDNQK